MKLVDLGRCNTCGREVKAIVDWQNFITVAGTERRVIQVEGHCGIPGHASRVRPLHIDDLDNLPEWAPETRDDWVG